MGQINKLESQICDILGPEAVSHVKTNISAVQATRVKGVNKTQLSKIWVVSEDLASKAIYKSTQLCKHNDDNNLYLQLSTKDRMLRYRIINSVFFAATFLAKTTLSNRGNKYVQLYITDKGIMMIYMMKSQSEFNETLHCFFQIDRSNSFPNNGWPNGPKE